MEHTLTDGRTEDAFSLPQRQAWPRRQGRRGEMTPGPRILKMRYGERRNVEMLLLDTLDPLPFLLICAKILVDKALDPPNLWVLG